MRYRFIVRDSNGLQRQVANRIYEIADQVGQKRRYKVVA